MMSCVGFFKRSSSNGKTCEPIRAYVNDMKNKSLHPIYVTLKCNWEDNPDIKIIEDMRKGFGEGCMTAIIRWVKGVAVQVFDVV